MLIVEHPQLQSRLISIRAPAARDISRATGAICYRGRYAGTVRQQHFIQRG
jgi:hypothetical protein